MFNVIYEYTDNDYRSKNDRKKKEAIFGTLFIIIWFRKAIKIGHMWLENAKHN